MVHVSNLDTLASLRAIVGHELDLALRRHIGTRVTPRPFELLGKGIGHASGHYRSFEMVFPEGGAPLPDGFAENCEAVAHAMLEYAALAGGDAIGAPRGRMDLAVQDRQFSEGLHALRAHFDRMDRDKWEIALRAKALADIKKPLDDALAHHGIAWTEFERLDLVSFVDDLPSRRVEVHLMRQVLKNRTLKFRESDLNDWAYVGCAVAYCDVVVTERHLANLLNRDGLSKKANVIADLRELPRV